MNKKRFILSTEKKNGYGFSVATEGIILSRFKRNPVMLYNHNYDQVIGHWELLSVEDRKLIGTPVFASTPKAKEIETLVREGHLKAASIGIRIHKMVQKNDLYTAEKTELLEASIVSVPSNEEALAVFDENEELMDKEAIKLGLQTKKIQDMQENKGFFATLGARLGLKVGADELEVEKKIMELQAENADLQKDKEQQAAELKKLRSKLQEADKARATALVEAALKDGKITADKKQEMITLATVSYEVVAELIGKKEGKKSLKDKTKNSEANEEELSFDKLRKENPQELRRLKAQDPEKYQEILNRK